MSLTSGQVLKSFIQVKRHRITSTVNSVGIRWRDEPGTNFRPRSGESHACFLLEPYHVLLSCCSCGNAYPDCFQSLRNAFWRLGLLLIQIQTGSGYCWIFEAPHIMSFGPQSNLCNREGIFRKSPVNLFGLDLQKLLSELHFFRDLWMPLKIPPFEIWISENIHVDMKDKVLVIIIAASRPVQSFFPSTELPAHSLKPG